MVIVNEITEVQILLMTMSFLVLVFIIVIIFLCVFNNFKVHNSYHKGYSEARNDNINYYETIRDLDNDFTSIMTIAKETVLNLNVEFFTGLINFGNKVKKLKNKY